MALAQPRSLWVESASPPSYPTLPGSAQADVAVVGGGIVGLTTAMLLKEAGLSVVLIDSGRIGAQVSGHTTAKVTSQHGLRYDYLIQHFGEQAARTYAESNETAIAHMAAIVERLGIDCDFERLPGFLYTRDSGREDELKREAEAAERLGLPADYVNEVPLPFQAVGAVRFTEQAQFQPYRYLTALAEAVDGGNGAIFEQTRALTVRGERPRRVITDRGTVTARDLVIATNLPFLDRGGFFAKAYPRRHLVIAAKLDPAQLPAGTFLSVDQPSRSLRGYRRGEDGWLIAVGDGFKPGHADTLDKYHALERFVHEHFPAATISHWWGNQDYDSMDRVPYIGHLTPGSKHLYTACGFNAWGMTLGTVAAEIISDGIRGADNPWADLYRATRLKPRASGGTFLQTNMHVAGKWIMDRVRSRTERSVYELAPGEGGLAKKGNETVAAYRDQDGTLHMLSPDCSHLRCGLSWNRAERSWDCPCHGSRFDIHGRVLNGPAVDDLENKSEP